MAVPSDDFIQAANDEAKQKRLLPIEIDGREYYAYAANLSAFVQGSLSLAMLVPREAVIDPFMDKVKLSSALTAGFSAASDCTVLGPSPPPLCARSGS